jgi:hypothetical protein
MMQPSSLQRFVRRLDKTLAGFFFIDQWVIMTARGVQYDSLRWADFRPIVPEKDRYWGDPFVLQRGQNYHVFVEEKIYATGRGRIACLTLDADGGLLSHQVALERDYHLSYPFLFEQDGEIFMIPETAERRTVELYRCVQFPEQWEFVSTLLQGIYAVDATLLPHGGRYWLFANVREAGGSSLNALSLFSAESPFSDTWSPHPRNPIVQDIRSARPAGRIFMQDGRLIRPSQDSSRRYGYGLRFNRITKLSAQDYEETPEARFEPQGGKVLATHTFNQAGDLTVIDAIIRRRK